MAILLYRHNEEAYQAALSMLECTGRAAVVHPTGTGKSFIGFKLCEEHPNDVVLWLSPSEYIYETQLEALRAAADGWEPGNVRFLTYARLMNLDERELLEICPGYIVLDEFHRCGARMWGQGVERLLERYPSVPVLGLSATAVRYLDSQRDMAMELFGGNVASEMTLGEAIVRGILSPPKYVLSVFQGQDRLDKYRQRAARLRGGARGEAEERLEALRRALERAEGLAEVFGSHMEERHGKYIVFCASYDHLCQMRELAGEWFAKVDSSPHVYVAYSEDPGAGRAFADFKRDESDHLKLLYCIDMLNEGIHVEGVSGVILLRPTASPTVYRQQIGRAMAAGRGMPSVIFDVVQNVEGLCSVGALREEMLSAAAYYRSLGRGDEVVNEGFHVTGEAQDCLRLFERLSEALTASWERMYREAELFYQENGNLDVPKRYVTEGGYALGSWLNTQRLVHGGKARGSLTDRRRELLDRLGMRWEGARDLAWERHYAAAKEYYAEHGDLFVGASDKLYGGVKLGRWIAQLRSYRKAGVQGAYLTEERVRLLDEIGMAWDAQDWLWERNYAAAKEYYKEHGNLDVPSYYVNQDGVRLGAWALSLRAARKQMGVSSEGERSEPGSGMKASPGERIACSDSAQKESGAHRMALSQDQIRQLNALGFSWEGKRNFTWDKSYEAACAYRQLHGNLDIPVGYVTEEGCRLGRWIRRQRDAGDTLSKERRERLTALGMEWERPDAWTQKFRLAEQYYREHGNAQIPIDFVVDGVWVGRWLSEQRARLNGKATGRNRSVKTLTEAQEGKLASIGIRKGESSGAMAWERGYDAARAYYEVNGHLRVPKRYATPEAGNLGSWIQRQRSGRRKGLLAPWQEERLERIGMAWEMK